MRGGEKEGSGEGEMKGGPGWGRGGGRERREMGGCGREEKMRGRGRVADGQGDIQEEGVLRLDCAVRRKDMGEAVEGEGAVDDSRACLHISVVSQLY